MRVGGAAGRAATVGRPGYGGGVADGLLGVGDGEIGRSGRDGADRVDLCAFIDHDIGAEAADKDGDDGFEG